MFVVRPLAISLSLASVLGATTAACSLIFGFDHFGDGTGAPCVGACDSGGGADVEQAADVRETASPAPTGEGGADGSQPLLDAGADAGADSAIVDAGSGADDAGEERGADASETGSPPIYIGCFQDSMARDLPYEAYDSPVNTNETCVRTCAVHGFRYAATQAGSQCFCGNAYENSVYAVQAPPPKPTYLGCFADMSSRVLPYFVYASSYNTTETCAFACAYHGYAYAGAQGRAQCFCGETYGAYGPASDCTLTCPGDATEMCGGNYANSVYRTSAPLDAGPPADGSAE